MHGQDPPDFAPGAGTRRPFSNTYWIEPGRLLAGEYPGRASRRETESRLKALLAAGIGTFIDLTEKDELPEYAALLAKLAPASSYRRFPLIDHGLPQPGSFMPRVLDSIDAALAQGSKVYVHCRAGVGRTGTVMGCWLIRRGLRSEEALNRLAALWQQSERSRTIPQVPETEAQARYVRLWSEAAIDGQIPNRSTGRIAGVLYGLALAEAAAANDSGRWSSDTAMTLLLAESLIASSGIAPDDQMRRYLQWQQASPAGSARGVPVPAEVRRALATWQWTRKPYAGSHDPANLDAHSLARTAAVALYFRDRPAAVIEAAADASRTTLQSPVALDACRLYAALLVAAVGGTGKQHLVSFATAPAAETLRQRPLKPEIDALFKCDWRSASRPAAEDNVVSILAAALWAFAQSRDFNSGLALLAANPASSSSAAVYGSLAGAHYSDAGLPADRLKQLADRELLDGVVRHLTGHGAGAAS